MTDWRPCSPPDIAERRGQLLQRIRRYFEQTHSLEVDTPALNRSAVSDRHIESMAVRSNLSASDLYLHTSPEFHMKRLLAAGYPDIHSLCRVFRDGETGRNHQPEFTMLEWYRLGMNLAQIVGDTLALLSDALCDATLAESAVIVDYNTAFKECTGLNASDASIGEMAAAVNADANLRTALGDARDDWLDLLLTTRVTPSFAENSLTVLQHYPASQAALARLSADDSESADRFEVFYGQQELANGYVELVDATEQLERFEHDQILRRDSERPCRPLDQHLIAALNHGLPQCAGVAMGVERLHMVLENSSDIRDVITFKFE